MRTTALYQPMCPSLSSLYLLLYLPLSLSLSLSLSSPEGKRCFEVKKPHCQGLSTRFQSLDDKQAARVRGAGDGLLCPAHQYLTNGVGINKRSESQGVEKRKTFCLIWKILQVKFSCLVKEFLYERKHG